MVTPRTRPRGARPAVLALVCLVAAALVPATAHAASARGGPISRAEVIWRAQQWVDRQPGPYDQGGYSPGPDGDYHYRRDCSGYVAMAWHLDANPWTGSLPGFSREIPRADLRPGDILNSHWHHVILFHQWTDDRGGFSYYTFGSTPVRRLRANIHDAYIDGRPNAEYKALRYTKIVEDTALRPHPVPSGRVVAARSADGRLEAFAAGADGVHHSFQTAVNGRWSPWRAIGGPRDARLGLVPNRDGRLELFALSGSVFQHRWQTAANGNWSGWADFGAGGGDLAVGANADGRVEVFAANATGVFHRWQTTPGAWSAWTGKGGPGSARLAMESAADGRLEVFALSGTTFGHLWQTAPSGNWSAWSTFGGGGHDLTANHNTDGRLEVFASGPAGVYHRWQTGPGRWSEWTAAGGPVNAELTSARTADGRVEVFAINGAVARHTWQSAPNASYSAWADFGTGGTEIAAGTNADGRVEVFGTSAAGVFHKWQTGFSTWSAWEWLADTAGPPIR